MNGNPRYESVGKCQHNDCKKTASHQCKCSQCRAMDHPEMLCEFHHELLTFDDKCFACKELFKKHVWANISDKYMMVCPKDMKDYLMACPKGDEKL